jgi:hypothetical protein
MPSVVMLVVFMLSLSFSYRSDQGILIEGEGSVQLTSSLWQLVLLKPKRYFSALKAPNLN